MVVRNTFAAAGAKDIPSLRRATGNTFQDLVRQLNRIPEPTRGDTLPGTGVFGQEFYLNADIPAESLTQGWYRYSDQWDFVS